MVTLALALALGGCEGDSPTSDAGQPEAGGDAARPDGPARDGPPRDGPPPDGPAPDAPAADGAGKLDGSPGADLAPSPDAGKQLCLTCVKLRVGRPLIVRGPAGDEIDTLFTVIPLGGGTWRGFSANSKTFAIDGAEPYAMGGARTQVLAPGNAGSYDECGRWLNYAHKVGNQVHGFIHAERSCNYAAQSQTHKSMAYATSSNNGLSWTVHGQIISGLDSPTAGKITGEGDCSVVDGGDGYYYAYCLRASDWKNIVARCPKTNPLPGSWKKYYWASGASRAWGGRPSRWATSGPRPAAGPPRVDLQHRHQSMVRGPQAVALTGQGLVHRAGRAAARAGTGRLEPAGGDGVDGLRQSRQSDRRHQPGRRGLLPDLHVSPAEG